MQKWNWEWLPQWVDHSLNNLLTPQPNMLYSKYFPSPRYLFLIASNCYFPLTSKPSTYRQQSRQRHWLLIRFQSFRRGYRHVIRSRDGETALKTWGKAGALSHQMARRGRRFLAKMTSTCSIKTSIYGPREGRCFVFFGGGEFLQSWLVFNPNLVAHLPKRSPHKDVELWKKSVEVLYMICVHDIIIYQPPIFLRPSLEWHSRSYLILSLGDVGCLIRVRIKAKCR